MKYAPEALYNYGPSGWQAAQWKEEKERLTYGDRGEIIETSPTQLGITSGSAPVITSSTPESRIGGELEITPDVMTPRDGMYSIVIRSKDENGIPKVQLYNDKFGRPLRWKPSLEDWEPYKKCSRSGNSKAKRKYHTGKIFEALRKNTVRSMNNISVCTMTV